MEQRFSAVVLAVMAMAASPAAAGAPASARPLGRPAPAFEQNVGQFDPQALFRAKAAGYGVPLGGRESVLTLGRDGRARVRMTFAGADPSGVRGEVERKGRVFYVSDPARPTAGAARFDRVRYAGAWPGTDVVFHGTDGRQVRFDFELAPGPTPTASASRSTAPTGSRSGRTATSHWRSAKRACAFGGRSCSRRPTAAAAASRATSSPTGRAPCASPSPSTTGRCRSSSTRRSTSRATSAPGPTRRCCGRRREAGRSTCPDARGTRPLPPSRPIRRLSTPTRLTASSPSSPRRQRPRVVGGLQLERHPRARVRAVRTRSQRDGPRRLLAALSGGQWGVSVFSEPDSGPYRGLELRGPGAEPDQPVRIQTDNDGNTICWAPATPPLTRMATSSSRMASARSRT